MHTFFGSLFILCICTLNPKILSLSLQVQSFLFYIDIVKVNNFLAICFVLSCSFFLILKHFKTLLGSFMFFWELIIFLYPSQCEPCSKFSFPCNSQIIEVFYLKTIYWLLLNGLHSSQYDGAGLKLGRRTCSLLFVHVFHTAVHTQFDAALSKLMSINFSVWFSNSFSLFVLFVQLPANHVPIYYHKVARFQKMF